MSKYLNALFIPPTEHTASIAFRYIVSGNNVFVVRIECMKFIHMPWAKCILFLKVSALEQWFPKCDPWIPRGL
jgi:hypothetical protein